MNFYTYSTPGAVSGCDALRSKEVFGDYADCGFTVMMLTGLNGYSGEGWEGSTAQKCFKLCKEAGIERIILDDNRLIDLIQSGVDLIGEGNRFATEKELDAFVESCMSDYAGEELLYGLRLRDEPLMEHLTSYAQVYRSIKRVAKATGLSDNFYIQVNMLPLVGDYPITITDGVERNAMEKYEYYLDAFAKALGADRLAVDNYPFRPNVNGGVFLLGYFTCFQILRRVCDRYGMEASFVLQSFEAIHKTKEYATAGYRRILTVNEMMLQMNAALGFGIRDISFYTYVTMNSAEGNEKSNYRSNDGSAFITRGGEKTRIYEFGKAAIAHAKKLEKTLFAHDFKGAKLSVDENCHESCKGLYLGGAAFTTLGGTTRGGEFDNSYEVKAAKNVSHDRDILLTCEFENGEGGSLLMFENVLDIVYKTDLLPMKVRAELGVKTVKAFTRGEWKEIVLKDGVFETELVVGEAVWLIPLA